MRVRAKIAEGWARQFTGDNGAELSEWGGPRVGWTRLPGILGVLGQVAETGGHLEPGDWLVKDEAGEVLGVKADAFAAFYQGFESA